MKLPEGTLYSYGDKWCFEDLFVKGYTIDGSPDWGERRLNSVGLDNSGDEAALLELGMSFFMHTDYGRHGLFNDEIVFLVFEKWDLEEMQRIIAEALKVADE